MNKSKKIWDKPVVKAELTIDKTLKGSASNDGGGFS